MAVLSRIRKAITFSILLIFSTSASAQQIISTGDCNANVVGNGNNISIYCSNRNSEHNDEYLLIFTHDHRPNIYGINFNYVVMQNSWVSFDIDDEFVDYYKLSDGSDGGDIVLESGDYPYEIKLTIEYPPGLVRPTSAIVQTTCKGIISVEGSAVLVSRFEVYQEPGTGFLYPIRCWFDQRS